MGRGGDGRTSPAERSPPSIYTKRKVSHDHHQRIRETKKLIISNSETKIEAKSLTLTSNSTVLLSSTSTITSSFITNRHMRSESYNYTYQIHKKRHRKRKKKNLAVEEEHRQWNYSTRDFSGYEDRIVFVSYNILGVENASKHPDLYQNVSWKYMDWDYRKRLLWKEIKGYKPDIMCFQEVDRFEDLDNFLRKDGFNGVHKARTGEACDGCAIFWKDSLFSLLHEETIEFQSFGLRNNVSQLCVFKMNKNQSDSGKNSQVSKNFLVGNIHVLFNPSRGDIKLGQMRLFLEKAQKLSQEWGSIPVVIAGDLNSMPQSAMYQFLTSSELDIRQHDRREISGQICPFEFSGSQSKSRHSASFFMSKKPLMHSWSDEELRTATGSGVCHLTHQLKLCSAYVGVHGSSRTRDSVGEPLATSYHSKFMGTVDYIWHTSELAPVRVLETLPIHILRKMGGLPSKKWGSDHLALVTELVFAENSNGE